MSTYGLRFRPCICTFSPTRESDACSTSLSPESTHRELSFQPLIALNCSIGKVFSIFIRVWMYRRYAQGGKKVAASNVNSTPFASYMATRHAVGFAHPEASTGKRKWTGVTRVPWRAPENEAVYRAKPGAVLAGIPRLSPRHRGRSFIENSVMQLEGECIREQLGAAFREEDLSTKLLLILLEPGSQRNYAKDEVVGVLAEGMRGCIQAADPGQRDLIFGQLAKLSLFPVSHPFLTELGGNVEDRPLLCEKIVALHAEKGVLEQSLNSFARLAVSGEEADPSLFRRSDTLSYLLCGFAVRHLLRDRLEHFHRKLKGRVSKEEPAVIAKDLFPRILATLRESQEIKSLLESACIAPIRERFAEADNLGELVKLGVIDMLFLRGICPVFTVRVEGEVSGNFLNRARFSSLILDWVKTGHEGWRETFDYLTTDQDTAP